MTLRPPEPAKIVDHKQIMSPGPIAQLDFLDRWQNSGAAERANYQLFLSELCDYLELPRPEPTQPDDSLNNYTFEKAVQFRDLFAQSTGRIDLYKKGCFVLEAKQGSEAAASIPTSQPRRRGAAIRGTTNWDQAMLAARGQAEQYAKALPISHGWPPFILVVDVGHTIELYADFSLTGKAYLPFPDPRTFRILLRELTQPEIRDRLRAVWLDPLSLDPSRHTARVTREVAAKLAGLAKTLENDGHPPKDVAEFLTRCIFTCFAEDVGLIPERGWLLLLHTLRGDERNFPPMAEALWTTMNEGGYSTILRDTVLQFNGGLFQSVRALPLNQGQLNLLIEAAEARWRDVEPAIFGTLLERALDPDERHALGAHYTPRAYVERLVIPTLVEPLREDWRTAQAVITEHVAKGRQVEAIEAARAFHRQLCSTRILDPACGSGNFLYVALEHMKRLEGEVLEALHSLGEAQQALEHTGLTVDPHQLLGLEVNPRAAVIADLVLWIGYLQWHFRTRRNANPPIPVIKNFHNIQHQDALLTWRDKVPLLDSEGNPVTRWNGVTTKEHPTTGLQIPDETARTADYKYTEPKIAKWPAADFIVGNPPFIGGKDMIHDLGVGYVKALRKTYDDVPDSVDFVMYWWQRAAELARASKIRRFGFITTNSLTQVFNRRVVAQNLNSATNPLSLIFAIPDHPWMKSPSNEERASRHAAVRIAMTVAERGEHLGHLYRVIREGDANAEGTDVELSDQTGRIFADLRIGVDVTSASQLKCNEGICTPGVKLHGAGFIVSSEQAATLGLGRIPGLEKHIRQYLNGRDLMGKSRNAMVIDLQGLTTAQVRSKYPEVYQWVLDRVKPERDQNAEAYRRDNWWVFGRKHTDLRNSLVGLPRYISTVETAKHRVFVFLEASVLPDNMLVNIASADAFHLGALSSNIHVTWALAAGGRLGFGNDPRYNKTRCFDPFPFPDCTESQKQAIRAIAERLDAHRKRQLQQHPILTLTGMYNVLEKLRSGEPLTAEEHDIYDLGLVGILRELHDELDAAVFAAYGWPADLTTDEILGNLVALNHQRRAEEANGIIRWLRPEYQAPNAPAVQQALGGLLPAEPLAVARRKQPWPTSMNEQFRAIKDVLRAAPMQTPQQIATHFQSASRAPNTRRVQEILETLTALGQTREVGGAYLL